MIVPRAGRYCLIPLWLEHVCHCWHEAYVGRKRKPDTLLKSSCSDVHRWVGIRSLAVPIDFPLGEPLDWAAAKPPARAALRGPHVLLRPVDAATDAKPLYAVSHLPDGDPAIWTYLPDGPYESAEHLRQTLAWAETAKDSLYFTLVRLPDERPLGLASYLRITPEFGVIEIGHIWFGVALQRTTAATEAIYLLARHAFDDLGYRRLEWKCNALNAASRRAAERFGFTFEGVFRKHQIVKGRNRDTAWYAITDDDWPAIRVGFESWLSPENFDSDGRQIRSLGELVAAGLLAGAGRDARRELPRKPAHDPTPRVDGPSADTRS
jgi:RimJ/RimL family protein N-acetyltransferase